mgnify:FL=1|jgi:uncharacterized protein YdcH (DUF465 family)
MITRHNLTKDFPEFADKIHELKTHNAHFRKLFDNYDEIDHEIYRIETDTEPSSDATLNQLRSERVRLKDEIFDFLSNN